MTNTNELNAVISQVLVVIDKKVIAIADCWEDAEHEVANFFENAVEGALDNSTVKLYNYVDTMESGFEFKVEVKLGDLMIGDESVGNAEEEFRFNDGTYQGMTFTDKDEVEEFFKEKLKSGDLTLEEVQSTEIVKTTDETWSFDDAELDDSEYTLEAIGSAVERKTSYGEEYVLASVASDLLDKLNSMDSYTLSIDAQVQDRIKKELSDADLVNVRRNLQEMTLEELNNESRTLQARLSAIHAERKSRK